MRSRKGLEKVLGEIERKQLTYVKSHHMEGIIDVVLYIDTWMKPKTFRKSRISFNCPGHAKQGEKGIGYNIMRERQALEKN